MKGEIKPWTESVRKHDEKRAKSQRRFGGRCSVEDKENLNKLSEELSLCEKQLLLCAVRFAKKNRNSFESFLAQNSI